MKTIGRTLLALQLANVFWLSPRSGWEFYFSVVGLAAIAFANGILCSGDAKRALQDAHDRAVAL